MRRWFRGKGCLSIVIGVVILIVLISLVLLGFGLFKLRGACIERTVPLSQAKETCGFTAANNTSKYQAELGKNLIERLKELSATPPRAVTLSEHEVETLLVHLLSQPLPDVNKYASSPIGGMGFFLHNLFGDTLVNATISSGSIMICAASSIQSSLISLCPLGGERGSVVKARLVPSDEGPGLPLKIEDVQAQKQRVQPSDVSSFQAGLNAMLSEDDPQTDSFLLRTFTKGTERITLENGSLTLHPKPPPSDEGGTQ